GVYFEITTRRGHSLTNGYVASCARKYGVPLVLNTDTHSPDNLVTKAFARRIARGAALTDEETDVMFSNAEAIVRKVCSF
ncbi:MAG: PHP domain-containing protein, partial [Syntrophobacterales bacterium]|nr:PHP domain-containing protein [Syntrophobacterales bacterium]